MKIYIRFEHIVSVADLETDGVFVFQIIAPNKWVWIPIEMTPQYPLFRDAIWKLILGDPDNFKWLFEHK